MPLRGRMIAVAAAAVFATACSRATAPREPRASVFVQRDTLVATSTTAGSVTWIQFTIPVAIRNSGTAPLAFEYCASSVEARVGADWKRVWGPVCAAGPGANAPIQPGETRSLSLSIAAAAAGPGGPEWQAGGIEGTYRFTAGLLPSGLGGRIPVIASNTFTLVRGS